MSVLPAGWDVATIEDVAKEVRSGFASGKHNATGAGVPHLRPMNVSRLGEIDLADVKYVAPTVDDRRLIPGDILFNNTNSPALVGKTALVRQVPGELAFSNHMTRVRTLPGIEPAFLAAQIHFLWMTGRLNHLIANHVNQASISARTLARQVSVAIAPTAEQKRIVAAIEEHRSHLDAATSALSSARARLRLMAAKIREGVITDAPLVPLGEIATDVRYGTSVKCDYSSGGPGVVRIPNIVNERIVIDDLKYATDPAGVSPAVRLSDGDVLFVRTNGSRDLIGRAAVARDEAIELGFASYLIRYRLRDDADPDYVCAVASAPSTRRVLEALAATTAGQYNLSVSKLNGVRIPLPSVEVQRASVEIRSEGLSQIARLAESLAVAERQAASLSRAISAAAFSGRLVRQDPEDEPASALLERIRAERASASPTKRVRRPRAS